MAILKYSVVNTVSNQLLNSQLIKVEVSIATGIPNFKIGGLGAQSIQEAKERIRSAIQNSGFKMPLGKIMVNLQPASLYKEGTHYDLPIAIAILGATGQINKPIDPNYIFFGELSLSGHIKTCTGIINAAKLSLHSSITLVTSPVDLLAHFDINTRLFNRLKDLTDFFQEGIYHPINIPPPIKNNQRNNLSLEINGQKEALRALEISCAGKHHMAMIGSPGTGKTFLAKIAQQLLPMLSKEQAIEVAALRDLAQIGNSIDYIPPYRAPHPSSSIYALIGGGSKINPGEISLAHHGILHIDEMSEFSPRAIEAMRGPMEEGSVHISRAKLKIEYPCKFQLIITANPCRCGMSLEKRCRCKKFFSLSGPMESRIDIKIHIKSEPIKKDNDLIDVINIRKNITRVHKLYEEMNQDMREKRQTFNNIVKSQPEDLQNYTKELCNEFSLPMRSYFKIWKIAYTISLYDNKKLDKSTIVEALTYVYPPSKI